MSVLENHNLNKFLKLGAFLSLDENKYLISWGELTYNAKRLESEASYYVSEFLKEKGQWLSFSNNQILTRRELKEVLSSVDISIVKTRQWQEPSKQEFERYFFKFQSDYRNQKIQKIVPVVFATSRGHYSESEKAKSLLKLLDLPTGIYSYGFWQEEMGFLGATPEVLIDRKDRKFKTMALAGTAAQNSESLLGNPKELMEHQFVIKDLVNKLQHCNLQWENTQEWSLGNLKHLRTFACGESLQPLEDLIRKLHPTAALGGAPSPLLHSYLGEYCDIKIRKYFGAPFGVHCGERELVIVALRNIQWFEGKTYLGSGCGLVEESELEREWSELQLKRNFTKSFLDL